MNAQQINLFQEFQNYLQTNNTNQIQRILTDNPDIINMDVNNQPIASNPLYNLLFSYWDEMSVYNWIWPLPGWENNIFNLGEPEFTPPYLNHNNILNSINMLLHHGRQQQGPDTPQHQVVVQFPNWGEGRTYEVLNGTPLKMTYKIIINHIQTLENIFDGETEITAEFQNGLDAFIEIAKQLIVNGALGDFNQPNFFSDRTYLEIHNEAVLQSGNQYYGGWRVPNQNDVGANAMLDRIPVHPIGDALVERFETLTGLGQFIENEYRPMVLDRANELRKQFMDQRGETAAALHGQKQKLESRQCVGLKCPDFTNPFIGKSVPQQLDARDGGGIDHLPADIADRIAGFSVGDRLEPIQEYNYGFQQGVKYALEYLSK